MPFPLGAPFQEALVFAARIHTDQFRKGTTIPYVSHVLAVASLALEHGASEDVAVAALLHDAVEDGGGLPVLEEIRERFGPAVASMVEECSDSFTTLKRPWRERKEAYLAHLPTASDGARLIAVCDKVHNVTSLVNSCVREGKGVWKRFNGSPEDTVWYYRRVVEILRERGGVPLLEELEAMVKALEGCVREENG